MRRQAYTKVVRIDFDQPDHVKGMGDKVFRGFQCLNKECTNALFVLESELGDDFSIDCPVCGYTHSAGDVIKLYSYELHDDRTGVVDAGDFEILHDDYVGEASRYKYCIVCGTMKPLHLFDRHSGRVSGRQGECNLCKQVYNSIKNRTRLVEQHREASQKRRLYVQFGSGGKLDLEEIYKRYDYCCFKCKKDLSGDLATDAEHRLGNLDHTLPAYYLWPMTTENATLLCREHNGEKAEKWPGNYYTADELRRLSRLTGLDYRFLSGAPVFNPEAVAQLEDSKFIEDLFEKFAAYPKEVLLLRNRILSLTGFDFLETEANISNKWKTEADELANTRRA